MIPKQFSSYENEEKNVFGTRKVFVLILLYKTLGLYNTLILPSIAFANGTIGTMIYFLVSYIVIAIPVMYMELIISQYTGRDCVDMWKIRPCLSHMGYFILFWQGVTFLHNHIIVSILLHYLIISFEDPPLHSQCGYWSTITCNIIKFNQTASSKCFKSKDASQECLHIYTTYPEYQYFYFNLYENKMNEFLVAWPLCVSSTVVIIILFLNCFKRIHSIKWFIYPMISYPLFGYLFLMIGSMRQKGLIQYLVDAMDMNFENFDQGIIAPANLIILTLYNIGSGSGVVSNLASLAPFRSPCLSNAVISVLTSAVFTLMAIVTSSMMACPYAFEYGGDPDTILRSPISFVFIKMPRMLKEYYNGYLWLLFSYTCQIVLGISNNVVVIYSLIETFAKKYERIEKYSALTTLIIILSVYVLTIPLMGTYGEDIIGTVFRKLIIVSSIFFTTLEIIVFMVWYGFDRFFEDIHFMQGIQPKSYMKVSWMLGIVVLAYIFCENVIDVVDMPKTSEETVIYMLLMVVLAMPVLILLVRLVVAAFRKKFLEQLKLDPLWGPQSDVLRRSRAMFTAHAMTKEYMYRQYHLQAGVVARQRVSNVRATSLQSSII